MNTQTPLARVDGLASPGGGMRHWRAQRYTALVLLLLSVWILWLGVSLTGADYVTARAAMSTPFNAAMTIFLAATMFYHTQLGLQVVIEDYVHIAVMESVLLLMVRLGCIGAFLITAIAVLKLWSGA